MSDIVHKGWVITAKGDVWVATDPKPIGVAVQQSFSSAQAACDYIDKRETDKMLFKIKNGV